MGLSDVQVVTGLKTYQDGTLAQRNPANTFTGTWLNPAITGADRVLEHEDLASYIIYKAGSNFKRLNNSTKAVEDMNTAAGTLIQATINNLGNGSEKSIYFKTALYSLAASLDFTSIDGQCHLIGEHRFGAQLRPTGDFPALIVNKNSIDIDNIYFTHNQSGYTSSLLKIGGTGSPATLGQISINNCSWYDFGQFTGNALGFDASTTATDIVKVNLINNLAYGFNNSIYASVGASPRFCNGIYNYNWQAWFPIRGLAVNIGSSGAFDNNNFFGFQQQSKASAPNQTETGFDYETNNSGHCWYTSHSGCMVWDLGTGKKYGLAPAANQLNITLNGCMPAYNWGGAGAAAGHIRLFDMQSVNRGKSTQSGNASTKVFNIAHGLFAAPTRANVTAGSSDARGTPDVTFDATNVILTYPTAPASGTNNLLWNWEATIF